MKLSEVIPAVTAQLRSDAFLNALEIIANISADHNRRLETALKEKGLCLVLVQSSGFAPKADNPRLLLHNEVVVSVLENTTQNKTGENALQIAERVLEVLHQASWATERGLRHVLQVDTPAYEAGPLDSGLILYFCNFQVKTLQP
jgi:hypothetical protein